MIAAAHLDIAFAPFQPLPFLSEVVVYLLGDALCLCLCLEADEALVLGLIGRGLEGGGDGVVLAVERGGAHWGEER